MSRIGMMPIKVPANVTVKVDQNVVTVNGPKGELKQVIARELTVNQEGETLTVTRPDNLRRARSQHGLARTLINNMVEGVTKGHERILEIHGVGYRATMEGQGLLINAGYSHPVHIESIPGVDFEVKADDKSRITQIFVRGIDKALIGQVAADIRKVRRPDPYKGKGIRYKGEFVRLKPGKRAGAK